MGYRLEITDGSGYCFYGTKLYGYVGNTVEELSNLLSIRYLSSLKLIKQLDYKIFEGNYWDYGNNNPIDLSAEQFNKFILMYLIDLSNYSRFSESYLSTIIDELLPLINDRNKHLEWGWFFAIEKRRYIQT